MAGSCERTLLAGTEFSKPAGGLQEAELWRGAKDLREGLGARIAETRAEETRTELGCHVDGEAADCGVQ